MASKNDVKSRAINYVREILFDQKINHFLHEKNGMDSYITLLSPTTKAEASIRFDKGEPGAEKGSPEGARYIVHEKATEVSDAVTHNFTAIKPLLQYLNVDNEKISDLRNKFGAAKAARELADEAPRMSM